MLIPKLTKIQQEFTHDHIADIEGETRKQIESSGVSIKAGSRIAIAAGSRGISNLKEVVKAAVRWVKDMGGEPFIVPAMGSHGGATAEGQREVLEGYGVTEEYTGAPIKSSMAAAELPQGDLPNKVFMDRYAFEADGTIIINRVKPHTDFHGEVESGLVKMCVIGLGKHKQALAIHRHNIQGLKELIGPTARQVLKHGNIIMGIGLVENAYDQTMCISAVRADRIETEDARLLALARQNMPSLPVDCLDVLIVDEMGKDISGVGIDTNIIGRIRVRGMEEPEKPQITNIVVTDLTPGSHGNALGVGLADVTTRKLYDKVDFSATYENVITSTFLERGKMPIVAENDRRAVEISLRTCGPIEPEDAKIIRIKNTLHLGEMYVSEAVLREIKWKPNIKIVGEPADMLDSDNQLCSF
jgi:hypothetical protein